MPATAPGRHRASRQVRRRRIVPVLLTLALLVGVGALGSGTAAAATPRVVGNIWTVQQDTFAHTLHVTGWAADPTARSRSIVVRVHADGHYVTRAPANRAEAGVNRAHHLTGKHYFSVTVRLARTAKSVTIVSSGVRSAKVTYVLRTRAVKHVYPAAGARIVTVAKRYVGKARYREGGASPKSGFDCSGYTKYVFAVARVKTLPHNAESQRRMKGMRSISAKSARPGDLVFYLSGGSAYHVAIYAGHHMQYAAATVRDGIRYQAVWSSNVQYRTDWH